uniref:F-box/LRR-repeat/kelch-repeat protein At2g27520-like n=1 Tax=Fragaria vesca subsp. vesca TaxID=101020 RepID=UPI0005CA2908|nr:PREDICTED: F-box/LRR-repeat/kelch-repeat protein At2g27520-like [Fragaria vesca subsp. vesca]
MEESKAANSPKTKCTIQKLHASVFEEIIIRLPIPDINQCKLVCKAWCQKIKDVNFVRRVKAEHGTKTKVCVHANYTNPADVLTLKVDDEQTITTETYVAPLLSVDSPRIIGSVLDIVLICSEGKNQDYLYMLNPINQTCRRIADECPQASGQLYGFGYNKVEGDYLIVKVVQQVADDEFEQHTCAFIFSLQRETWRRKRLRNFKLGLSQYVGSYGERLYFCDFLCENLVTFDLSMEDIKLIPLPPELEGQVLTFGVARERLGLVEAIELLLICCRNPGDGTSSLWRLKKKNSVDLFENLAVWDDLRVLRSLSYLSGDPNRILLLEDRRVIQVYNMVQ